MADRVVMHSASQIKRLVCKTTRTGALPPVRLFWALSNLTMGASPIEGIWFLAYKVPAAASRWRP